MNMHQAGETTFQVKSHVSIKYCSVTMGSFHKDHIVTIVQYLKLVIYDKC